MIHRFWWHPADQPIPEVGQLALKCVSPRPQKLWSYAELDVDIPGVQVVPPQRLPARTVLVNQVTCRVNWGFIAAPRHDAHLRNLALELWTFWSQYLRKRLAGNRSSSANRQNQRLWMRNTNTVHDYLEKHAFLSAVLPAHAVSPFPLWLQKWRQLGSCTFGYTLPSMTMLERDCIFVNLWDVQVNGLRTGDEMRRVLAALRASHGLLQPSLDARPTEEGPVTTSSLQPLPRRHAKICRSTCIRQLAGRGQQMLKSGGLSRRFCWWRSRKSNTSDWLLQHQCILSSLFFPVHSSFASRPALACWLVQALRLLQTTC